MHERVLRGEHLLGVARFHDPPSPQERDVFADLRAEAMSCVTTMYVPPWSECISWISSHSSAVRTGSRPESGSSKITMSGSITSARANPARLRMPPESWEGRSSHRIRQPDVRQALG